MMKKIIAVLTIGIMLTACGGSEFEEKQSRLNELKSERINISEEIENLEQELALLDTTRRLIKTKYVEIASVQSETFRHFIEVQGSVESDRTINVNPKMGGIVTNCYVKIGQNVAKNQILAELDANILLLSIEELKTGLETATIMYNKQKELWDQNIGTEVQYIQAKAQKVSLEKKLATLKEQLDMTKIKATVSGTIDMVKLKEGEAVSPAFPVIRIVNLNDLKIVAHISDSHISKINKGDSVFVSFPHLNQEVKTTIDVVSKVIDTNNRTFSVEIMLPRTNGNIRPNMLCALSINDLTKKSTITLPINMIQKSGNEEFVYVAVQEQEKWIAKKQTINTGLIYNGKTEIIKGLKENDKIISAGYNDLTTGQQITINN
jgi:RND family efflux transporter MFP subunit